MCDLNLYLILGSTFFASTSHLPFVFPVPFLLCFHSYYVCTGLIHDHSVLVLIFKGGGIFWEHIYRKIMRKTVMVQVLNRKSFLFVCLNFFLSLYFFKLVEMGRYEAFFNIMTFHRYRGMVFPAEISFWYPLVSIIFSCLYS